MYEKRILRFFRGSALAPATTVLAQFVADKEDSLFRDVQKLRRARSEGRREHDALAAGANGDFSAEATGKRNRDVSRVGTYFDVEIRTRAAFPVGAMLFLRKHSNPLQTLFIEERVNTYHFCPNRTRLVQDGQGRSLRFASLVVDDPYFGVDMSLRCLEEKVVAVIGNQNSVNRRSQERGHGEVEGVFPLDGGIRLGHAQVIRGGDTASLKFGQQRRRSLEIHKRKLTLECFPSLWY
jgi:hypothetical protein